MRARYRGRTGPPSLLIPVIAIVFVFRTPLSIAALPWNSLPTDHFEIVYLAGDPVAETAAQEVAALAPDIWNATTAYMRYSPKERVPVVLRSDTAQANGYFTPLPPHIELFISAPSKYQLGSRTSNWLELVFTHELIHYLHLTRPKGFFGTLSWVFGPLTASGSALFMPGWAIEGPTVYGETILTPGGRGEDPFFEMTWLAPIYENSFYSYDQGGYASPLPPQGRIYSTGYIITDYIHRTYGADGYHRLNETFMRWPFLGMRRAVRKSLGLQGPTLFYAMAQEIRRDAATRFLLPSGKPITPTGIANWHLIDATDTGITAWMSGLRHPGGVYLLPRSALNQSGPDGTTSGASGPIPRDTIPLAEAWRPLFAVTPIDSSSVSLDPTLTVGVAAITHTDYAGEGSRVSYSDLHLISRSEGGETGSRRLTKGQHLLHPAISPDQRSIIAVQRRGQYSRLVIISPDDGEITPIYDPPSARLFTPRFSPDGTVIAVVENRRGAQDILLLRSADGELLSRIGSPEHQEFDPRFTGTNDSAYRILYGSDAPGRLVVKQVTLPIEGGAKRYEGTTIIDDPIGAYGAVYFGDSIVYQTYRSAGHALHVQSAPTHQPVAPGESVVPDPSTESQTETPQEDPPVVSANQSEPYESSPFLDLPRPVFWIPTVSIRGGTDEETSTEFGVYALGASVTERHQLELDIAYNPTLNDVLGMVAYSFRPKATSWTLAVSRDYTLEDESNLHGVYAGIERPVWYQTAIDRARGATGALGTYYSENADHTIEFRSALQLYRQKYGASGLFLGNSRSELLTRVSFTPELLDQDTAEVATQTVAGHRSWIEGSRVYLGTKATFTSSRTGDAMETLPFQGGRFDPAGEGGITSAPNAILGSLSLHVDLGPYDNALRGVANTGSLISVYVEQSAVPGKAIVDFQPRNDVLRLDNYTTLGTSIGVDLHFNTVPFRLTGGVAMRLPHSAKAGPNAVRFFLNFGGAAWERISGDETPRIW